VTELATWVRNNSTLVYFLVAQAAAILTVGISFVTYMTNLEARVSTLEVRGSPHLSTIDNRLTVLESQTKENKERIDRISEIMLRDFGKPVK
jgi:hypothetical protein